MVDLSTVGRYALASDIRQVGDAHRKSNQPVCAKHRAHDVNIKQVASTHPGIVGNDDIARPHGLGRKSSQHMAHGGRGGAGERGHRVATLGEEPTTSIEDHTR